MANTLNPTYNAICIIKTSISNILLTEVPPDTRAAMIAPLLEQVNRWATQIPATLDNNIMPTPATVVFAIRNNLYLPPLYTQCLLDVPSANLPAAFHVFLTFILKLIDAQKTEKEKPVSQVRLLV